MLPSGSTNHTSNPPPSQPQQCQPSPLQSHITKRTNDHSLPLPQQYPYPAPLPRSTATLSRPVGFNLRPQLDRGMISLVVEAFLGSGARTFIRHTRQESAREDTANEQLDPTLPSQQPVLQEAPSTSIHNHSCPSRMSQYIKIHTGHLHTPIPGPLCRPWSKDTSLLGDRRPGTWG